MQDEGVTKCVLRAHLSTKAAWCGWGQHPALEARPWGSLQLRTARGQRDISRAGLQGLTPAGCSGMQGGRGAESRAGNPNACLFSRGRLPSRAEKHSPGSWTQAPIHSQGCNHGGSTACRGTFGRFPARAMLRAHSHSSGLAGRAGRLPAWLGAHAGDATAGEASLEAPEPSPLGVCPKPQLAGLCPAARHAPTLTSYSWENFSPSLAFSRSMLSARSVTGMGGWSRMPAGATRREGRRGNGSQLCAPGAGGSTAACAQQNQEVGTRRTRGTDDVKRRAGWRGGRRDHAACGTRSQSTRFSETKRKVMCRMGMTG